MKQKMGLWLAIFGLTILSVLGGWQSLMSQVWNSVLPISWVDHASASAPTLQMPSLEQVNPPMVNSDRLLDSLESLVGVRYTDRDRQATRDYITAELTAAGWTPQTQIFTEGVNIYAEHPGTDLSAGTLLVAAHYDTVARSPGADDNGTGVAAVLEIARQLSDRVTPRTLKLVFFDQEERGLLGSLAFAADATQRQNLVGVIVLDMIGYACDVAGCQSYPSILPITPPTDRGNFLAVLGDHGHQPLIRSFHVAHQSGSPLVLSLPIPLFGNLATDFIRSDHSPFWQQGIGAVMVTDTANFRNPNYHQPSDTLETIQEDFFVGSTQTVLNATLILLNSTGSLASNVSV